VRLHNFGSSFASPSGKTHFRKTHPKRETNSLNKLESCVSNQITAMYLCCMFWNTLYYYHWSGGSVSTNVGHTPLIIWFVQIMFSKSTPSLGHTQKTRQGPNIWIRTRSWPSRALRTQNHRQFRRLRDPNPTEGVPNQDTAQIVQKQSEQSWES